MSRSPDGEGDALRIDVGGIDGIQHVVERRDGTGVVGNLSNGNKYGLGRVIGTYDGELDVRWANFCADLVDIVDPGFMRTEVVGGETNKLDATSSKVGGTTGDLSELGGADLWKDRNRRWVRDRANSKVKCVRV